jgi:hypothetical protein
VTAPVRHQLARVRDSAHGGEADVSATAQILDTQVNCNDDLPRTVASSHCRKILAVWGVRETEGTIGGRMRLDMDLGRAILLKIEENPQADGSLCVPVDIDGRNPKELSYHVGMLQEAGFLEAMESPADDGPGVLWTPTKLTYSGHEFINLAREDTFWEKAKIFTREKAGVLTFAAVLEGMKRLANAAWDNLNL